MNNAYEAAARREAERVARHDKAATDQYARLPQTSGTPYEAGTTTAQAATVRAGSADDRYDRVVVDVRFGNVFSETVTPLTIAAAKTLRDQLDAAIADAESWIESPTPTWVHLVGGSACGTTVVYEGFGTAGNDQARVYICHDHDRRVVRGS